MVEAVNKSEPTPFNFDYRSTPTDIREQIYCRSDHYNYARYGIPITFFTTGLHADYHQVTDEPQYIDYEHMRAYHSWCTTSRSELATSTTASSWISRSPTRAGRACNSLGASAGSGGCGWERE